MVGTKKPKILRWFWIRWKSCKKVSRFVLFCMFFIVLYVFLFPCLFVLYVFLFPGLLYCMFFSPLSFVGLPLCILLSNWYFRLWFWSNYSSFPNEKSFHSPRQGWGSLLRIWTLIRTKTCLLILQKKVWENILQLIFFFLFYDFIFLRRRTLPCEQFKTV